MLTGTKSAKDNFLPKSSKCHCFLCFLCCLNTLSSGGKIITPRWDCHEYLCCFIHPKLWGSKLGVSLLTALAEELVLPKWSARLTITPYITLVRVRSVQDRFKSHPFNGYLWNRNWWFNIYQMSQRFPENTSNLVRKKHWKNVYNFVKSRTDY